MQIESNNAIKKKFLCPMMIKGKVVRLAKNIHQEVIDIDSHLHQHPELSFQEFQTSDFICSQLNALKIPYKKSLIQALWSCTDKPNSKIK